MGAPVRLHLGCGARKWKGFINVDLEHNWSKIKPDVSADITKPLPFPDKYADEIHAIHVVEHFNRNEVVGILKDWRRVLKDGGKLCIEVPCLDKIAKWLANPHSDPSKQVRMTLIGLYGEWWHDGPGMVHQWCYSEAEIKGVLGQAGFQYGNVIEPLHHQPLRDMRVVAR